MGLSGCSPLPGLVVVEGQALATVGAHRAVLADTGQGPDPPGVVALHTLRGMTIALASIGRRRIEEVKSSKITEKLFIKSISKLISSLWV